MKWGFVLLVFLNCGLQLTALLKSKLNNICRLCYKGIQGTFEKNVKFWNTLQKKEHSNIRPLERLNLHDKGTKLCTTLYFTAFKEGVKISKCFGIYSPSAILMTLCNKCPAFSEPYHTVLRVTSHQLSDSFIERSQEVFRKTLTRRSFRSREIYKNSLLVHSKVQSK